MPEWGGQSKLVHIDKNAGKGWSTCPEFAPLGLKPYKHSLNNHFTYS